MSSEKGKNSGIKPTDVSGGHVSLDFFAGSGEPFFCMQLGVL